LLGHSLADVKYSTPITSPLSSFSTRLNNGFERSRQRWVGVGTDKIRFREQSFNPVKTEVAVLDRFLGVLTEDSHIADFSKKGGRSRPFRFDTRPASHVE
jgi:hypothetical protein